MFSSDTICYFNAGSSDTAELLGNYLSKILIKKRFFRYRTCPSMHRK